MKSAQLLHQRLYKPEDALLSIPMRGEFPCSRLHTALKYYSNTVSSAGSSRDSRLVTVSDSAVCLA